MAQNEVNIKIRISDDGDLELISKKADKAAQSTDTLTQSRNRYNKGEKGVAGATANSTKAFSKMQQSMMGGGGLVPAYATLAANVFALSAAFGVLRRAAQVEQLEEGLRRMGAQSGLAMETLSRGLQQATGNALTLEEAMRSTAMITSAGLDPSMIEQFGVAAKTAALALGRNTQDSLERFTRGVTKLEPELLDELGIFVKLDEAYEQYAIALGKNVNQLTSFEKRQAFANATLDEATKKFGALSDIDANPFDQLAAAFADLSKSFIRIISSPVAGFVQMLADSTGMLIGVTTLFASTISTQLLGSFKDYADKAQMASEIQLKMAASNTEMMDSLKRHSKTIPELTAALEEGNVTQDHFNAAINGQNQSLKMNKEKLDAGGQSTAEYTFQKKRATKALVEIRKSNILYTLSQARAAEADTMAAISSGNLATIKQALKIQFSQLGAAMSIANAQTTAYSRTLGVLRVSMAMTAAAARAMGAAITRAMGPIGIAITVIMMLAETAKAIFEMLKSEEQKNLEKNVRDAEGILEELTDTFKELDQAAKGHSQSITTLSQRYIALGNATSTAIQAAEKIRMQADSAKGDRAAIKVMQEVVNKNTALQQSMARTLGTTTVDRKNYMQVLELGQGLVVTGQQVKGIETSFKALREETTKFFTDLEGTTPLDNLANSLQEVVNSLEGTDDISDINKIIEDNVGQGKLQVMLKRMAGNLDKEALVAVTRTFKAEQARMQNQNTVIKGQEASLALVKAERDFSEQGIRKQIEAEEELRILKEGLKKIEIESQESIVESVRGTELQAAAVHKLVLLQKELKILQESALSEAEKELKVVENHFKNKKMELDLEKKLLQVAEKDLKLAQLKDRLSQEERRRAASLFAAQRGRGVSAFEEAKLLKEVAEDVAGKEGKRVQLRKDAINIEYDLLEAQFSLEMFKLQVAMETSQISTAAGNALMERLARMVTTVGADGSSLPGSLDASRNRALLNVEAEEANVTANAQSAADVALAKAVVAEQQMALDLAQTRAELLGAQGLSMAAITASRLANEEELARLQAQLKEETDPIERLRIEGDITNKKIEQLDLAKEEAAVRKAILDRTQGDAPGTGALSMVNMMSTASGEDGAFAAATMSERFAMLNTASQEFEENIKKFGPEGELMASINSGMLSMAESFSIFFESMSADGLTAMDKLKAGAAAVSTTIGAINGIRQNQAKVQEAAIEREINAEKKRDGKSKESLAKIRALEKKKEQIARKAFEQNKKAQLAQAIINGMSAIQSGFATQPFFPMGILMGALATSMTLMQIQAIRSQTFDGGGATPGNQAPTSINVGQQKKSVDLARSRGAAGERSYFLGNRGIGGPETFRPAFTGMKYRANGGNAAFMVGEQGPEVFVPNNPGTIIPSDETTTAAPINANINISAVDAAGVEELLVNQRGNIIGMLREAANAGGETFLESVSIQELT